MLKRLLLSKHCRCRLAADFLPYQAVGCCSFSFPLAGNAHRAFRGGKRGRMTFVMTFVMRIITTPVFLQVFGF